MTASRRTSARSAKKLIFLVFIVIIPVFSAFVFTTRAPAAASSPVNQPLYASFRDVPGVNEDEIRKIEALIDKYDRFVYGMPLSTEAFLSDDGEIGGYTALLCGWLSELFEIPFVPVLYDWLDLLDGLETGEISFSGELTATEERLNTYYMTDAIASRPLKYFCLSGGKLPSEIIEARILRCGFIESTATIDTVTAELEPGAFEVVLLSSADLVYDALKSGEIDAFYYSGTAEANFTEYSDMLSFDFYPLIYRPVSLATRDPELEAIISVTEKILAEDGLRYLTTLYNLGHADWLKYKLNAQFTDEERLYIKNSKTVPVGVDPGNYPGSFFDKREKKWQGIFLDMLDEVSSLTGLNFERVNDENTAWPEIYQMLISGEVAIVPELTRTKERQGLFLWPEMTEMTDYYALISNSDHHDIRINEILYVKVGVAKDTAFTAIFNKWFPNHMHTFEYESMEEAFDALRRGDVDMVMASQKRLLYLTHYLELPGYKANVVFDQAIETKFGFNIDEAVLCSIVDKALGVIDTKSISDHWMRKTYDYRTKLAEERLPLLIGAAFLLAAVLILAVVLLQIKHGAEKKLKILVEDRTYELQRETSTLMAIFNSIPDLIFHMDSDLRYVRVNASMEKHFNLQLNDMIGKTDKDLLNIPESVKRSLDEMNKKVLEDKKPMTFEEIVPTFDGKEVIFETTKVPLRLNGQVFGLLGIARDITRRKAMEEEAKAASLSKSTFLANMSHELRTPLNVIIGLTDLTLEEEGLTSSVTTNLINVSNAGRTLLSIVNDILDISKIESGKLSLIPEEYHMSSLLNDTITLFNTYVGEKPIDFKLHISEELPSMLFGDELRVKQILTNLLSNAVKYTPEGTVDLAVTCERDKNDAWLDIIVKDTGIGIRKEDLESLFSDYYQADAQTNRKTEGTGLGLSITRKLSELMDGAVTVESEYGKGSTFRTRLRQGFVDAEPIGVVVAANLRDFSYIDTKRQKSDKLVRVDLTGKRVLVVDDMQNNLDVAAGLMRKYKMHVDCVTNGPAAIDRIRDKTPVYNAVFMDHMMPGMDGIETAVAIRALGTEYALDLPIIALTANAVAGTQQQFFENGFQDFLSKPIDIMRLDAVLKKWLRSRSSEPFQIIPEASEAQEISENEAGIPTDIPGVDTAKGLALYGGNSDIYLSVLRSFAANTHKITAMLRDATPETLSECLVNAHGLKGTAANICAEDLRAKAAELEAAARGGDLEKYSSLSDSVAAEAELLTKNLIARLKAFDELNVLPRQNAPDRDVLTRLKESCKIYDMTGIDEALDLLESKSYETGSELVLWLREKIDMAELDEVVARLSEEEL